jgi:hypothetical protein
MGVTAWSITQNGRFEPFELQVSRGQISWHETRFQFGVNNAVGTSFETIWTASSVYAYLSAASVIKVSSANASDTSAGTGARTVTISGLDANYSEISETVTLSGQTAVNTVNSYLRVFNLQVLTAGSGGTAVGIIYAGTGSVTSGVPATVYAQIEVGYNKSAMAIWTVPAGYTAYVTSYTFTTASATANNLVTGAMAIRPYGGVFSFEATAKMAGGNTLDRHFDTYLVVEEKSDIEMQATASSAAQVTGEMQIIYIKNDANA